MDIQITGAWNFPTRVITGPGRIAELPEACRTYGLARPLLVTDHGLAKTDLIAWRQNITQSLPGGSIVPTGSVNLDAVAKTVTVSVKWDDTHADVTNTTGTPATTDIVTFSVVTQLSN